MTSVLVSGDNGELVPQRNPLPDQEIHGGSLSAWINYGNSSTDAINRRTIKAKHPVKMCVYR